MSHGQNSSIVTAYATLVTVAVGLIGLDLHVRHNDLPDFPSDKLPPAAHTAEPQKGGLLATEQQTASASTAHAPTL